MLKNVSQFFKEFHKLLRQENFINFLTTSIATNIFGVLKSLLYYRLHFQQKISVKKLYPEATASLEQDSTAVNQVRANENLQNISMKTPF